MDLFNAKLSSEKHVKIFGGEDLKKVSFYSVPTIKESVEYDSISPLKLHSNEWYFVELDDKKTKIIIDEYRSLLDESSEVNQIKSEDYDNINVLYLLSTESLILTSITKKYILKGDTVILGYGDLGPTVEKQKKGIKFSGDVTVYFDKDSKKLYFKSFINAKKVFPWLIDFYRIADEKEINDFLKEDFFEVSDDFQEDRIGERIRKNIASVIDTRNIDFSDKPTREAYNMYANEFSVKVEITSEGKFEVKKNVDLTNILKLLQGHYFKDYIDPTKNMEATSCKQVT